MYHQIKKSLVLLVLLSIVSCATSHRDNRLQEGLWRFRGGYSGDLSWKEYLVFKRVSWVSGVSVFYDALVSEFGDNSPYWKWLSETNQKEAVSECKQFLISVLYNDTSVIVSHSDFIKEMRNNGFSDFLVPELSAAIKSHPDFSSLHMQNAKTMAFCKKSGEKVDSLKISLPSFQTAHIKL